MAFGNISTFYIPPAGQAGSSQWGTDVRKMLDTLPSGGSDTTTITSHGTGTGAATRTIDPYTTSSTDGVQADFGWAIDPTDMNSVAGALRFYPPGNHVARVRMGHNGTAAETGTIFMYVYRVSNSAGGRARTLLGSNSATVAFPALSGEVNMVCTVVLPEVVFAADETVQYSFELTLNGVPVTGHQASFFTGNVGGTFPARVETPILGVLADTTGTAVGTGTAASVTGTVLNTTGSAGGSTVASGVGSSRADTVGAASGIGTAVGAGSSVAGTVGTASGIGTATGLSSIVLGTVGTVIIGSGGGGSTTTYIFPILD